MFHSNRQCAVTIRNTSIDFKWLGRQTMWRSDNEPAESMIYLNCWFPSGHWSDQLLVATSMMAARSALSEDIRLFCGNVKSTERIIASRLRRHSDSRRRTMSARSSNQVTNANLSASRHQHPLLHVSNEQSTINIIIIIIIIVIRCRWSASSSSSSRAAAAVSVLVARCCLVLLWPRSVSIIYVVMPTTRRSVIRHMPVPHDNSSPYPQHIDWRDEGDVRTFLSIWLRSVSQCSTRVDRRRSDILSRDSLWSETIPQEDLHAGIDTNIRASSFRLFPDISSEWLTFTIPETYGCVLPWALVLITMATESLQEWDIAELRRRLESDWRTVEQWKKTTSSSTLLLAHQPAILLEDVLPAPVARRGRGCCSCFYGLMFVCRGKSRQQSQRVVALQLNYVEFSAYLSQRAYSRR